MRIFFKMFFAALAAVMLVLLVLFFMGVKLVSNIAEPDTPEVKEKTVLVIDLGKPMMEQGMDGGFNFPEGKTPEVTGIYDMVRAIKQAATDTSIKGIYLKCNGSGAGYAGNAELRAALIDFKKSKKFIYAYGQTISQRGYELANVADKIYLMPLGAFDWMGYSIELTFFKNALDKLEVTPEIIYAGKFKSATEPFRVTKMSEPNRIQLTSYLEEAYGIFLQNTATSRGIDTAALRQMANTWAIKTTEDAAAKGLITASKYDDEVRDEMKDKLGIKTADKINVMPIADYIKNKNWNSSDAKDKIALIYAEGDIVEGKADGGEIGGETYSSLIRKARTDKTIKALVLRVNSPGGSVLASEAIWREVALCKKEKPVVVSMGDYAASGGYYISCGADSIFAQANTLTGSIGVFIMYFDAQRLLNNKLGITFDAVKTSPYADFGTPTRPMTEAERQHAQADVDHIYATFLSRVSEGRKLTTSFVDSIAQGRIWSGKKALELKLVDRIGNIQDAIDCAARMAKLNDYQLREWPITKSFWEKVAGEKDDSPTMAAYALKQQIGPRNFEIFSQLKRLQTMAATPQMRLPFFSKTY